MSASGTARASAAEPRSWASLARTARVSVTASLATGFALVLLPQMRDMLAYNDYGDWALDWPATLAFNLSLAFLAFSAWYWARTVLKARFRLHGEPAHREALAAARSPGGSPPDPTAFLLLPRYLYIAITVSAIVAELKSLDWPDALVTLVWSVPGYLFLEYRRRLVQWLNTRDEPGNVARISAMVEGGEEERQEIPEASPAREIDIANVVQGFLAFLATAARNFVRAVYDLCTYAPFSRWLALALMVIATLAFVASALGTFEQHLAGFSFFVVRLLGSLPGPGALFLCLGLLLGPLTFLTYRFDRRFRFRITLHGIDLLRLKRPPVLSVFFGIVLVTPMLISLHNVRVIEPADVKLWPSQRVSLDKEFRAWQASCARDVSPNEPLRPIVVAVSGGASRAGLWAARVLTAVGSVAPQGQTSIFAISSVSGGSLGAAEYLAMLAGQTGDGCRLAALGNNAVRIRRRDAAFIEASRRDALGPALAAMLYGDVARALLGAPAAAVNWLFKHESKDCNRPVDNAMRGGDRAEALEDAFQRNWANAGVLLGQAGANAAVSFDAPFLSLFYSASHRTIVPRGNIPIWIANGTDDQSGDRIITAPFDFRDGPYLPFAAARDALGLLHADVRISTAISNTARFPFLSPSGEMAPVGDSDGQKPAQIIDGGYFENEGMQTALELAEWLRQKGTSAQPVEPILVQVTADADPRVAESWIVRCSSPFRDDPKSAQGDSRPMQLLAPVEGVYTVRSGHSQVVLREARARFCPPAAGSRSQSFFHFYLYGSGQDIPLNWLLSRKVADYIWTRELSCCGNGPEFAKLKWLMDSIRRRNPSAGKSQ